MIYGNLLTTHFLYIDNVLKGASSSFIHKEMETQQHLQERRAILKQNKKQDREL